MLRQVKNTHWVIFRKHIISVQSKALCTFIYIFSKHIPHCRFNTYILLFLAELGEPRVRILLPLLHTYILLFPLFLFYFSISFLLFLTSIDGVRRQRGDVFAILTFYTGPLMTTFAFLTLWPYVLTSFSFSFLFPIHIYYPVFYPLFLFQIHIYCFLSVTAAGVVGNLLRPQICRFCSSVIFCFSIFRSPISCTRPVPYIRSTVSWYLSNLFMLYFPSLVWLYCRSVISHKAFKSSVFGLWLWILVLILVFSFMF